MRHLDKIYFFGRWALFFGAIGIVAGLGAVLFQYLCELGMHYFLDLMAGYRPPKPAGEGHLLPASTTEFNRWILLFLPAAGGIISGWLVYTFAPEAEGHGTDSAIDAYHNKKGIVRGRIPVIKTLASAITLTTGGSGGREGPIAQIGAGFGSFMATKLKLSNRERRIMLAAGIGAGVGSIFRAPLAGALFSAEVLYRDPEMEAEVVIPAGIASVVGYCVFCMFFGWGTLFQAPEFSFDNPLTLGPYTVLAFLLAGMGFIYVFFFYKVQDVFRAWKIPNHLKPAVGGILTGMIGFYFPHTLAFGYGYIQNALSGDISVYLLLTLALGKILTTGFTIGSGGSGGVFGPSVVIGGALGGIVGQIFHRIMPGVVTQPEAFIVVGMAGFFAGVSNTPISTIIFISEMTSSYNLLLPSLLVCSLTYVLSTKWTIYIKQPKNRIASAAHAGDFFINVLEQIKVRDLKDKIYPAVLVPEYMTFKQFKELLSGTEQRYFCVVDKSNRMKGIFSSTDLRGVLFEPSLNEVLLMGDLAKPEVIYVTGEEDLNSVMRKFTRKNIDALPVVEAHDRQKVLGMLNRRAVIDYYNRRVGELRTEAET
ncbi:MAG: chloride channel protein [Desulfonatronovibrionaceae bacterium]